MNESTDSLPKYQIEFEMNMWWRAAYSPTSCFLWIQQSSGFTLLGADGNSSSSGDHEEKKIR